MALAAETFAAAVASEYLVRKYQIGSRSSSRRSRLTERAFGPDGFAGVVQRHRVSDIARARQLLIELSQFGLLLLVIRRRRRWLVGVLRAESRKVDAVQQAARVIRRVAPGFCRVAAIGRSG
jgi:hypothetical protein